MQTTKYIAKWSFIDSSGAHIKTGQVVEYDFMYASTLIGKGLIIENKAADTSKVQTKQDTKTTATKTATKTTAKKTTKKAKKEGES